jgi:hypothetical protein
LIGRSIIGAGAAKLAEKKDLYNQCHMKEKILKKSKQALIEKRINI